MRSLSCSALPGRGRRTGVIVASVICGYVGVTGAGACSGGRGNDGELVPGIGDSATSSGLTRFDCVGILHVRRSRGHEFANVHRLGQDHPAFRETLRIGELAPEDLEAFCDWEACVRTNGYAHVCAINDAGWERCRVCDGGDDCGDLPFDRAACVARAHDLSRSACHVGLMQECLIQRGLRGFADRRVTQTCQWSTASCAGELPGDLRDKALFAQNETNQVTVEYYETEVDLAAALEPDSPYVDMWRQTLRQWEGGRPTDVSDAAPTRGDP